MNTRRLPGIDPEIVAFYYPQFHRTELNDHLYGVGYTEWDNVQRARPLFDGHDQPRQPAALGYYDLEDSAVYDRQVAMARAAGISGFCLYHYWFGGERRALQTPLRHALTSTTRFPFCLMWANHDWTLAWRGRPHEVTVEMTYGDNTAAEYIADVAVYLRDPRYLRVDGAALLLVYDVEGPADLDDFVDALRRAARANGIGELFVCGVQRRHNAPALRSDSLDALCEFPPHGFYGDEYRSPVVPRGTASGFRGRLYDYRSMVAGSLTGRNRIPGLDYIGAATPDWDNTGRRLENLDPTVFRHSSPLAFGLWLQGLLSQAANDDATLPLVFVNAWNEWGEGAYLEPDRTHGGDRLGAVSQALADWPTAASPLDLARRVLDERAGELVRFGALPTRRLEVQPGRSRPARLSARRGTLWIEAFGSFTAPMNGEVRLVREIVLLRGFAADPQIDGSTARSHAGHRLVLRGADADYTCDVPAIARPDVLETHGDWLDAGNVARAGFEAWLDLGPVTPGRYRLAVEIAEHDDVLFEWEVAVTVAD